ncbi:hypothetical protein J3459_007649 [Metarhizium acridum]|nr:hypothetical protein J3459_007649 [Metarhizium acridum]
MIDSLQSLTRNPLPAITALNLRANRLQSLAGVEKLYPLERLDLRDNRLSDPLELARLTGIPDIREIWLDGNPFTRTHKDYRVTIFNIFRSAPGCTEDIIIDGYGPSYSEKRLLIERAPIPDSVPVVKPMASDSPAVVDVSKPTIVYNSPKEASVLRQERPVAKAVTSEVNINSSRRRKVSKRRIVDLATGDSGSTTTPTESLTEDSVAVTEIEAGNYRITRQPDKSLLPPVILTDSGKTLLPSASSVARATGASGSTNKPLPPTPSSYDSNSTTNEPRASEDWDAGGEMYRRRIEALRDRVGSGYLSVLSEESWDGTNNPFLSSGVPSVATLRTGHVSHHVSQAQPIHSGRTMG